MRQYINIVHQFLFEAQTPTGPSSPGEPQRKPKSTPQQPPKPADEPPDPFDAFEPYDPFAPKPEQPLTGPGAGATPPSSGESGSKLPGKTSTSARDVHMRGELPPEAGRYIGDFLGRQHDPDDLSDEEAMRRAGLDPSLDPTRPTPTPRPEIPRNPENLPVVIGREMMARNDKDYPDTWEPNWTMVRHLPGYLQNAIRAMGRQVFRQFTNTPLEDIQVMASPMINSEYDLNRMAAFIRRYGIKDDEAVLDFMQSMPGYNADVALYRLADYEFLVVRDFAGHYIYGWPGGRGVHLSAPRTPKRLRENQKKKPTRDSLIKRQAEELIRQGKGGLVYIFTQIGYPMEQAMSIFAKAYGHGYSDPNVKEVFDTLLTLGSLAQLYGIDSLIKQTWDYDGHVEHDIWWDALTKQDVAEFKQKLGAPNSDLGDMLHSNGIHDLPSFDAFMGKKSIATKIREIVTQLPDRDDLESYFAVLAGRDELFDEVPPEPWVDLWQLFFESSPGQNY